MKSVLKEIPFISNTDYEWTNTVLTFTEELIDLKHYHLLSNKAFLYQLKWFFEDIIEKNSQRLKYANNFGDYIKNISVVIEKNYLKLNNQYLGSNIEPPVSSFNYRSESSDENIVYKQMFYNMIGYPKDIHNFELLKGKRSHFVTLLC